jgi:FAD/FMN-containing dehydrogenase
MAVPAEAKRESEALLTEFTDTMQGKWRCFEVMLLVCFMLGAVTLSKAEGDAAKFETCISSYLLRRPASKLEVVYQTDLMYATYNTRNFQSPSHARKPVSFGLPADDHDVSALVKCANAADIRFTARGGGHSYIGASLLDKGLVIDMSRLAAVLVSPAKRTAQIGAGQLLGEVYLQLLNAGNYTLPGGRCPGVGISGHTLGGGLGHATRQLGWLIDSLVQIRGVTAEGDIVTGNSSTNPDLLWAAKGGGPDILLVTDWTFKIHPAPPQVSHVVITAPHSSIEQLLAAYVAWKPWDLPPAYAMVELSLTPAGDNWIDIFFWGPMAQAMKDIQSSPLSQVPGFTIKTSSVGNWAQTLVETTGVTSLDKMSAATMVAAQYSGSMEGGTTHPGGYRHFKASSLMFNTTLSPAAQQALVTAVTSMLPEAPAWAFMQIRALGGSVIQNIGQSDTALPHRDVLLEAQVYVEKAAAADLDASVQNVKLALAPYTQSHPFFYNYIDCDDYTSAPAGSDPWRVYFGDNAARLRKIKQQYDPKGRLDGKRCAEV